MAARVRPITDFVYEMGHEPGHLTGSEATVTDTPETIIIDHENTVPGTNVYGIEVDTTTASGAEGAGIAVINDGYSDGIYIAARGPTSGTASPVGVGIDVNRSAVAPYTGERNADATAVGIEIDNYSTTNPVTYGSQGLSVRNMDPAYTFPAAGITAGHTGLQIAPWVDPAPGAVGNTAFRIIDSTGIGTPRLVITYGGWIGIGVSPPTAPLDVVGNIHVALPGSNPGPGMLWNDGGTVKVGT